MGQNNQTARWSATGQKHPEADEPLPVMQPVNRDGRTLVALDDAEMDLLRWYWAAREDRMRDNPDARPVVPYGV